MKRFITRSMSLILIFILVLGIYSLGSVKAASVSENRRNLTSFIMNNSIYTHSEGDYKQYNYHYKLKDDLTVSLSYNTKEDVLRFSLTGTAGCHVDIPIESDNNEIEGKFYYLEGSKYYAASIFINPSTYTKGDFSYKDDFAIASSSMKKLMQDTVDLMFLSIDGILDEKTDYRLGDLGFKQYPKKEIKPLIGALEQYNKETYKVTSINPDDAAVTCTKSSSTSSTLVIPDSININGEIYKVTAIDKNAFKGNKKIKKITIGKNITSIGASAFQKASNLKSVIIKGNDVTVGASAFSNTSKLETVKFEGTVKEIRKNAFSGAKKLKSVTINGNYLKSVGKNAFKGVRKNCKITIKAKNKSQYNKVVKLIKKSGAKNVKFVYKKN